MPLATLASTRRIVLVSMLLPLLLVPALGACVTASGATQELEKETFLYHRDLRWQRFGKASKRVDPKLRERFMDHCSELEGQLSIESVDLLDIDLDETNEKAVVRVRINFILQPSMSLQTALVKERWVRVGGSWHLVEGAWPLDQTSS